MNISHRSVRCSGVFVFVSEVYGTLSSLFHHYFIKQHLMYYISPYVPKLFIDLVLAIYNILLECWYFILLFEYFKT